MRIALVSGATTYPLAGESGIDERVHSSAADYRVTGERSTDIQRRVRALTAKAVDRKNLATTITFSTTRKFSSARLAFLYTLDHDTAVGCEGTLVMVAIEGGTTSTRHLLNAVVSPPTRQVIGCTVLLSYTVTGGGIITPA